MGGAAAAALATAVSFASSDVRSRACRGCWGLQRVVELGGGAGTPRGVCAAAHLHRSPPLPRRPQISGSVSLDGSAHQALLAPGGPGLRHYRVPQHLHW